MTSNMRGPSVGCGSTCRERADAYCRPLLHVHSRYRPAENRGVIKRARQSASRYGKLPAQSGQHQLIFKTDNDLNCVPRGSSRNLSTQLLTFLRSAPTIVANGSASPTG